jgi:hypothetical protein
MSVAVRRLAKTYAGSLRRARPQRLLVVPAMVAGMVLLGGAVNALGAATAQPPVGLGTAAPFAILAGSTVTNTGPSVVSGDVGLDPGTAVTGFPPGTVKNGTTYVADNKALQAKADLKTAYNDAAGRTPVTTVSADLGGQKLAPGVYHASSAMQLTGTLTLDGQGNADAVFIFQAGSTLITASSSTVVLIRGAQACNVFWQVGSSATLGTGNRFVGTIMALTSTTVDTGTTVTGRLLARNGAVTLDDDVINQPTCSTPTTTTTTTSPGGVTTTTTPGSATTTTTAGGAGGSTTTTAPGSGATTTTTAGGATTTTVAATVPPTHTGEPWAGWPYWAIIGILGSAGVAITGRAVSVRRRRE